MEGIFSWVKNIVIFVLVLSLIEEVLPDADYKKYIRAAAGMVFILVVFSPLLGLFNMTGTVDYYFQWESFKTAFAGSGLAEESSFDEEALEARRQAMVISQYENNLKEQIRVLVENQGYNVAQVGVCVDESQDGETFGAVKSIVVRLRGNNENDSQADDPTGANPTSSQADDPTGANPAASGTEPEIQAVEPVVIGETDSENEGEKQKDRTSAAGTSSGAYAELRRLLSENYGVHMNNISIIIGDGDSFE